MATGFWVVRFFEMLGPVYMLPLKMLAQSSEYRKAMSLSQAQWRDSLNYWCIHGHCCDGKLYLLPLFMASARVPKQYYLCFCIHEHGNMKKVNFLLKWERHFESKASVGITICFSSWTLLTSYRQSSDLSSAWSCTCVAFEKAPWWSCPVWSSSSLAQAVAETTSEDGASLGGWRAAESASTRHTTWRDKRENRLTNK